MTVQLRVHFENDAGVKEKMRHKCAKVKSGDIEVLLPHTRNAAGPLNVRPSIPRTWSTC